jgi:replicative DNA helicase
LIDSRCLADISNTLTVDDFSLETSKAIFKAAQKLDISGRPIDPVTIKAQAQADGIKLDNAYFIKLMDETPTAANVGAYIPLVKADSQKRQLYDIANRISEGLTEGASAEELIATTQTDMQKVCEAVTSKVANTPAMIREWMDYRKAFDKDPNAKILRTGYSGLDKILGGGLMNGDFYVIGARPGAGKTTLGLSIIDKIASSGKPVYFASLEMTKLELTAKRISRESGLPYGTCLMQKMTEGDYRQAYESIKKLQNLPVDISDEPRMTVNDIMFAARKIKGLRCICVDHFSLISPGKRTAKRYDDMTLVSNDLKRMAKTLNVPVICLAQLNRENEGRTNKRPMLSDLRETGAIEQDADTVMFVHRESIYNVNRTASESETEPMELIVAKNRHGACGKINMVFCGKTGNIYEEYSR